MWGALVLRLDLPLPPAHTHLDQLDRPIRHDAVSHCGDGKQPAASGVTVRTHHSREIAREIAIDHRHAMPFEPLREVHQGAVEIGEDGAKRGAL